MSIETQTQGTPAPAPSAQAAKAAPVSITSVPNATPNMPARDQPRRSSLPSAVHESRPTSLGETPFGQGVGRVSGAA